MAQKQLSDSEAAAIAERILSSRKYAALEMPRETVTALIAQEAPLCKNAKETEKAVREKLHQIIAPYLGDPDYAAEETRLASLSGETALKDWALSMLNVHASSRERIPYMEAFYRLIFEKIGVPASILDPACAFHPFAFPWMGLSKETKYASYDLHSPRVRLINSFFMSYGMEPLAEVRDILLDPPTREADAAFFFKEAHRFESRKRGCCRAFWQALKVPVIVVTLPAENLTGQHQMRDRQRSLVERNIEGLGWTLEETEMNGEMIFIIRK